MTSSNKQEDTAIVKQGTAAAAMAAPRLGAVMDIGAALLAPVEMQAAVLTEYADRRKFFFGWIQGQLVEGVHYGHPPGTRPQDRGKQWKSKPSLYKAGALMVIDLLRLRPEFHADKEIWAQLGSSSKNICFRCDLYSRDTGERVGEGRGQFEVGEKGMKANSAIKMAQKRSLVDACINSVPVAGDLFTQDCEDMTAAELNKRNPPTPVEPPKLITEKQSARLMSMSEDADMPAMVREGILTMLKREVVPRDLANGAIYKAKMAYQEANGVEYVKPEERPGSADTGQLEAQFEEPPPCDCMVLDENGVCQKCGNRIAGASTAEG